MPPTKGLSDLVLAPSVSGVPLYRWLYDELRRAILEGRLKAGLRLPSTRSFAQQYRIARGTVVSVFEQLLAEGYLETKRGAGSFVRQSLPERFFQAEKPLAPLGTERSRAILSRRGERLAHTPYPVTPSDRGPRPFRTDHPALDVFPTELWSRVAARRLRRASASLLTSGDALGYRPLREAIATYLGPSRGITCSADEVVITTGTQQSLDLTIRMVLDEGDQAWMEDPGYPGAVSLLRGLGAEICPIPVDADGIDCAHGAKSYRAAKFAYVTPAHQFPLGVALSAGRRLELLQWAQKAGAWIFEDDYDGEFRFSGRPLAALRSLDERDGCVVYAASFSKMLFPTLRLGYMIVPQRLVDPIAIARSLLDRYPPVLEQAILSDFISEGHFGHHIRRMRELYAKRLEVLRTGVQEECEGLMRLAPHRAGLQTVGWLDRSIPASVAAAEAARQKIEVTALSHFSIKRRVRSGLLLGFALANERSLRRGMSGLAAVLREIRSRR